MSEADPFAAHRPYLFGLAYRMLGSASDAEDILQDAYVRYATAPRDDLRVPRAYFTTVVTRLCLDQLKAARTTREHYVGTWLPEPVLTPEAESDPQRAAERHESITQAFLVLLETLNPTERAVFLLREVFEYPYDDIAAMVQTSPANCRQMFHRAKTQLAVNRPRFSASSAQQRQLVAQFLAAVERGDVSALQQALSADAHMWADSGGKMPAPRRPVHGRDMIAKLMLAFMANTLKIVAGDFAALRIRFATVNEEPAALAFICGQLDSVLIFTVEGEQIAALRVLRNPDKLAYLRGQLRADGE